MKRWAAFILCFAAWGQTPEALRRDVEYLASDELEGRATPSPGLDKAAGFIFNRFREVGLEARFQTANFADVTVTFEKFVMSLNGVEVGRERLRVRSLKAVELQNEPVLVLPENGLFPAGIAGRVVAGEASRYGTEEYLPDLQSRKPAMILLFDQQQRAGRGPASFLEDADAGNAPVIRIKGDLPANGAALSVHLEAPTLKPVPLRNVVGVLSGSDPVLRDQYVLVTAHYDHVGKSSKGIFHGANDNASGTASVMEIAAGLAGGKERPRRTVVFIAFFGEERGLLGSYYYARHPLFPLAGTVANLNLEQMGRAEGHPGTFGVTGQTYSTLPAVLAAAARKAGVTFLMNKDADSYFARSDNYPFAMFGIPNVTAVTAFDYADYHGLGDTVDKLDFENMALVDRALAAGVVRIANSKAVAQWSDSSGASMYRAVRGK